MDGSDGQRPRKPYSGPRRPVMHVDENGQERRWDSVLEARDVTNPSVRGIDVGLQAGGILCLSQLYECGPFQQTASIDDTFRAPSRRRPIPLIPRPVPSHAIRDAG